MLDLSRRTTVRAVQAVLVIVLSLAFGSSSLAQAPAAEDASASDARAALVEILRDDEAREALIAELERSSDATSEVRPAETPQQVSIARQIATFTQESVQGIAAGTVSLWNALKRAPDALDGIGAREIGVLLEALRDLVLVIVSTIVAFLVLQAITRRIYAGMGERARRKSLFGRWVIFGASVLIDAGVVILAWAIGYGLAATVIGQFGEIAIRQSLYLNAFLAVEMGKVLVRLVISPAASGLRPLPISDEGARRLYRVLNIGISLVGYGLLLVVPIVAANASPTAGNSVATIIVLLTALYLGAAAMRWRTPVAEWLLAQGRTPVTPVTAAQAHAGDPADEVVVEETSADGPRLAREPRRPGLYATLARRWHIGALIWLGLVLLTALTRPVSSVIDILQRSGLIVLAILLTVVLSGLISRAIGRGISLPAHVNERLPRLEAQLGGFVPQILTGVRVALSLALALFVLDVAGLFDTSGWLSSPGGITFAGTFASVVAIVLVAFALWIALTSWVEYRLNPDFGSVPTPRERTLLALLRNALTIVLLVITLMFALSEVGLDIGPLLASAGVLGLAIGFGAQKLVQDVITGVFIQLENAMNVGDVVTAGPVTGVVEKLTIRSVSLRDLHGVYHLIPFSSVDAVSNFTRDFSNYVVDMGVAYREDVDEAKQAMFDAFEELRADPEQAASILDDLEWFGLDQFADSAIVLRARIKTLPGKQWGVGRAYNAIVKRVFDERGIEIPFPHTTLFFGENKKGNTQKLRVEASEDPEAG